MNRISLGVIGALLLLLSAGGLYTKHMVADNARLRNDNAGYAEAIKGWEASYDVLLNDRALIDAVLARRTKARHRVARETNQRKQDLDHAENDDCLDRPMPADVIDILRTARDQDDPG